MLAEFRPFLWIEQRCLKGLASVTFGYSRITQLLWKTTDATPLMWEADEGTADSRDEILYAQTVRWMLENSTEQEDILACADNIPTISCLRATQLIARSPFFSTLVQHFEAAVVAVSREDTQRADVTAALTVGKAIAHTVIANPIHYDELIVPILNKRQIRRLEGRDDIRDLWILCIAFWYLKGDKGLDYSRYRLIHATAEALLSGQQSTFLILSSILKLSPFGGCFGLIDFDTGHGNALISLLYLEVTDLATGA